MKKITLVIILFICDLQAQGNSVPCGIQDVSVDGHSRKTTTELDRNVAEVWKNLKAQLSEERYKKIKKSEEVDNYWREVIMESNALLWEYLVQHENSTKIASQLFEQFGKGSPQEDLLLLASDPRMYMITYKQYRALNPKKKYKSYKELVRWGEHINAVCEKQVELFIVNPKIMKRYYEINLYFKYYLIPTEKIEVVNLFRRADLLVKEFTEKSPNYWWHARQFVAMAYSTGQYHQLKDVKPGELHIACQKWYQWLRKNFKKLSPNHKLHIWEVAEREVDNIEEIGAIITPKKPFENWGDLPIPTKDVIDSVNSQLNHALRFRIFD